MANPTKRPLSEWLSDLRESEAEIAAGITVPLEPVLERIRERVRRLETKQRAANQREAVAQR
jgi:hypothetical protein